MLILLLYYYITIQIIIIIIDYNKIINKMIILVIALFIILSTFILINYLNKTNNNQVVEGFMTLYDDINDYLKQNIDKDILRNSYCFDNDKLLSEIKGDPTLTCAGHYENVSDIHYKFDDTQRNASQVYNNLMADTDISKTQEKNNTFYDTRINKSYSFAEICPVTTKQLNATLCLRKHNNDISDTMYRLNNVLTDTEIVLRNNLADIDDELNTYRNDKYRLFNSSEIQEYNANNQL
jgi:type II secretory pathway pseudopilin PulG